MNLKDKTDKELWDMLDKNGEPLEWFRNKYEIHQEIIRREKGE